MWPEFETAVRSALTGRVADPDLVMGIVESYAHKYLLAGNGARPTPAIVTAHTARPIAHPPRLKRPARAVLLDPLDLRPGSIEASVNPKLLSPLGSTVDPLSVGGATVGWTDADLLALTRDTTPYTPGGDWFDVRAHLLILYTLAKWCCWGNPKNAAPLHPPLCLEIGVREGPSTLALLSAMRETGGTLLSIDNDPVSAEVATDVVHRAGLAPWWQLRVTDSDTFADGFIDALDLLWLDGDHSYEQVTKDLAHFLSCVRQDGFAVLHDYYTEADPADEVGQSGVARAVAELRQSGGYEILTLPWAHGLTLVRVL